MDVTSVTTARSPIWSLFMRTRYPNRPSRLRLLIAFQFAQVCLFLLMAQKGSLKGISRQLEDGRPIEAECLLHGNQIVSDIPTKIGRII